MTAKVVGSTMIQMEMIMKTMEMKTSPNQAGVAEPRLKIGDKYWGQTDRQMERQTQPDIELLCN